MKRTYKKPEVRITQLTTRVRMLDLSGETEYRKFRYKNDECVDGNLEAL